MGVAVSLDNLVRYLGHLKPKFAADRFFHRWRHGGVGADSAGNHAHPQTLDGFGQPFFLTPHLVPPEGEPQAHGHRFGVDAVGAAHGQGVFVFNGLGGQGGDGPVKLGLQEGASLNQLQVQAGVQHIVGGESEVEPAALRSHRFSYGAEERRYIVAGSLKKLHHATVVILGAAQLGHVFLGDNAFGCPCLAGGQFHGHPFEVFIFVGPDLLHGGPGIPVNHSSASSLRRLPPIG